jgi:hypothetical protein
MNRGAFWNFLASLHYSPKGLEEEFCELRLNGVLRSFVIRKQRLSNRKEIAHFSGTPAPIREYGTHVTDKGTP